MPRYAIIWTRSRKLSLNVMYHLTHRMMISWSKCRPLNRSCAEVGSVIPAVIAGYRAFQQFAPEPPRSLTPSVDSSKRLDHFLEKLNGGVEIVENAPMRNLPALFLLLASHSSGSLRNAFLTWQKQKVSPLR